MSLAAEIFRYEETPTYGRQRTHKFRLETIAGIEPGYAVKFRGTKKDPLTQSVYDSIRSTALRNQFQTG